MWRMDHVAIVLLAASSVGFAVAEHVEDTAPVAGVDGDRVVVGGGSPPPSSLDVDNEVIVAWESRPPYAMAAPVLKSASHSAVVGIDVDIVREALRRAGYRARFVRSDSWQASLDGLERGEVDAVMGAFLTQDRLSYSVATDSYRNEKLVLFVDDSYTDVHGDVRELDDLIDRVRHGEIRLGFPRDFYAGEEMMELLDEQLGVVRMARTELSLADAATVGRVDAFIADWLSGHDAIRAEQGTLAFTVSALGLYEAPVHTLFRIERRTPELVARFDAALASMREDGRIDELKREFGLPSLLAIAMSGTWYWLLDAIGTVAFAISGVMIARRERFSIFGATILAGLPAIGGGALRDVLVARYPLGIFVHHSSVWLLLGTVAAGYLVGLAFDRIAGRRGGRVIARASDGGISTVVICDAIGLASFTITGLFVAMSHRVEPLIVWGPFLALITAAGGGILRDVVRAERRQPTLTRSLYAELSILGAMGFVLWGSSVEPLEVEPALLRTMVIAVMVFVFTARIVAVRFDIPAPAFRPLAPDESPPALLGSSGPPVAR